MQNNLVFDIGLNNGDDAAYYLHLGHRVVGVEANPLLAAQCARRFAKEIAEGRMEVVNQGVMRVPGQFTFYLNLQQDAWSTFEPDVNRKPGEWKEMPVQCSTTAQLIERFGKPHFLKVDIEGADFQILETLTPANTPTYISLELNCHDPFVERLADLGYDAFKFVDGETYRSATPILDHQLSWRVLRRIGLIAPPFDWFMRRLPATLRPKAEWNPPGKYSPEGYAFTRLCSGPFGESAAGEWLDVTRAGRWFRKLKSDFARAGRAHTLWWDVHARHSSAANQV